VVDVQICQIPAIRKLDAIFDSSKFLDLVFSDAEVKICTAKSAIHQLQLSFEHTLHQGLPLLIDLWIWNSGIWPSEVVGAFDQCKGLRLVLYAVSCRSCHKVWHVSDQSNGSYARKRSMSQHSQYTKPGPVEYLCFMCKITKAHTTVYPRIKPA